MTLSAAIIIDDSPVNLSDILASSSGSIEPHISIPTNIDVDKVLPPEWMCPVTGLVRKTYIIANNLAVSVAGDSLAAKIIIKRMIDNLSHEIVSIDELRVALSGITGLDPYSASLSINMVANGDPQSFFWDSIKPHVLRAEDWIVNGSGSEYFHDLVAASKLGSTGISDPVESIKAISAALCSVFFALEWRDGKNIQHQFGGGFEAVYFDGTKFRFVENYSICMWEAKRVEGKLQFEFHTSLFRVFYCGNILCIKGYEEVGIVGPDREAGSAPMITLVPPLIGKVDREAVRAMLVEQGSYCASNKPEMVVHIVFAEQSELTPDEPDDTSVMILNVEREADGLNFCIEETRDVLHLKGNAKIFEVFEEMLMGDFTSSVTNSFDPKFVAP